MTAVVDFGEVNSGPPLSRPPTAFIGRFDVQAASARLRDAQPSVWMTRYAMVVTLLGAGTAFVFVGATRAQLLVAGIGAFMLALGVLFALRVLRNRQVQLVEVDVYRERVVFRVSDGTTRVARWVDAQVRLTLGDFRSSHVYGMRRIAEVPCTVYFQPVYGGLTLEAFLAIRQSAIDAGVPVVDSPPGLGGRIVQIGHFRGVPLPMGPPGRYA